MQVNENKNVKMPTEQCKNGALDKKEIKDNSNEHLGNLNLINEVFKHFEGPIQNSSENTDLILNNISTLINKNALNPEVPKSGETLANIFLNDLKTLEKSSETQDENTFIKNENDVNKLNNKFLISKIIVNLLSNNSENLKNPNVLLFSLKSCMIRLLQLENNQTCLENKTSHLLNENNLLKSELKKHEPNLNVLKYIKEIIEIKNHNQSMVELYEKETEKLRFKLQAYKKAVSKQLDNLHLKLGQSVSDRIESTPEIGKTPEILNLGSGIEQDSGWLSANEQPIRSNPQFDYKNPFEQSPAFDKTHFYSQAGFTKIKKNNQSGYISDNFLTPSVLKNGFDNNMAIVNSKISQNPDNNFYQKFFTPVQPTENMNNKTQSLLMKRSSETPQTVNMIEDPKLINVESSSKISSTSKKSRHVRRQDLRFWTLKKAIFCWDGEANLEIVYREFVKNFSLLLGDLVSPNEPVIEKLNLKAFTKSNNKPNLLAIKIVINPRYKSLIEQSWKNGSPSKFFKLKIDLIKENLVLYQQHEESTPEPRSVKNMQKFPARYNFSQATYTFNSKSVNKDTINKGILTYLKKIKID
jgi:hypothetical protein